MRRRAQGFGPAQWQRLPGSFAASGEPILVTTQVSDHPDSRRAGGVWLRADHGTLVAQTSSSAHPVETYFAPAARAPREALEASLRTFRADPLASAVLDAMPDLVLVLNPERQIVAMNRAVRDLLGSGAEGEILGLRPGEAVGCLHATDMPGGCGTGPACLECGAVHAIMECLDSHEPASHECRLCTGLEADGGLLELDVMATFLGVQDTGLIVLCLRNLGAEKRRAVLERAFFHNILHSALGLHAVSRQMDSADLDREADARLKQELCQLSGQILEQLATHRQEAGESLIAGDGRRGTNKHEQAEARN
jgi:hypothetical protein